MKLPLLRARARNRLARLLRFMIGGASIASGIASLQASDTMAAPAAPLSFAKRVANVRETFGQTLPAADEVPPASQPMQWGNWGNWNNWNNAWGNWNNWNNWANWVKW